jgi:hypothetical protein
MRYWMFYKEAQLFADFSHGHFKTRLTELELLVIESRKGQFILLYPIHLAV